ncbi:MAG: hypothetical protein IKU54_00510 [Oscillospiraceae bacterium]|nr:hypothetical protein [Oscillospiraceae bacterium]
MDNEFKIQRFVQKRKIFRKASLFSTLCLVAYALIAQNFLAAEIAGPYYRIYNNAVIIWVAIEIALNFYIGYFLSTCPICHISIPTVKNTRSGEMGDGNGPLPDFCPWCGADFRKYK